LGSGSSFAASATASSKIAHALPHHHSLGGVEDLFAGI
jgi:hypothetical protein